jgi:hypothetical protein
MVSPPRRTKGKVSGQIAEPLKTRACASRKSVPQARIRGCHDSFFNRLSASTAKIPPASAALPYQFIAGSSSFGVSVQPHLSIGAGWKLTLHSSIVSKLAFS